MRQTARSTTTEPMSDDFIENICTRLAANRRVRRTLPANGRLHIDRQIPFLCVYRIPEGRPDVGTRRLVEGEASYLVAPGERTYQQRLSLLVKRVAETLSVEFGAFLVAEVWTPRTASHHRRGELPAPAFRILANERSAHELEPTVNRLEMSLRNIRLFEQQTHVAVAVSRRVNPPGMSPILLAHDARKLNCWIIGLEVQPVYCDGATGTLFPLVLQTFHRGTTRALKKAFFEFVRTQTTQRPSHYHVLGRQAMVKAVWEVDRQLARVSDSFDFLLLVTPINAASAWSSFRRGSFEHEPVFVYRPLPVDPSLLKRMLYNIPTERVEDLTLSHMFQEKQRELDLQIGLLAERGTRRFLYGSLQLFGGVDARLRQVAEEILRAFPPHTRDDAHQGFLDAKAFASRATEELNYYRQSYPALTARVEIRNDINTGLMVSQGNLLIGKETMIPVSRVEALLHHEIGTHVLTYFNGQAQPFHQLHAGLAGYEELQEGLAVLAEYLGGNLSRPRLRLLAARVLAAACLVDGATFVETFGLLTDTYQFEKDTAFTVTMRIYRGGGLTKDAVYLRGLLGVMHYVQGGGDLSPLFVGKIAAAHIPIVRELQMRGILQPSPLQPRYMDQPLAKERLAHLRRGISVLELVC